MKITIKQHYVPQFYLRNFSNRLYGFDKKDDNIFPTSPKQIAFEPDFYGPDHKGKASIEKVFSEMEKKWSHSVRELIRTESFHDLRDVSKYNIISFMSYQFLRTKQFRQDISGITNSLVDIFLEAKGYKKGSVKLSNEGEIKHHLDRLMDAPVISKILSLMKFSVVVNKTYLPFWTSDNPLNLQNDVPQQPPLGNLGFGCRGIEIHIPLNPRIVLTVMDPTTYSMIPEHIEIKENRLVHRENYHQYLNSSRFLFSDTKKFSQRQTMLSTTPEVRGPDYVRFSMVNGLGERNTKKVIGQKHIPSKTIKSTMPSSSVLNTWIDMDYVQEFFKKNDSKERSDT